MRYIGADANFANNAVYTYTAAGGETSISGVDNAGNPLLFTSGSNVTVPRPRCRRNRQDGRAGLRLEGHDERGV